MKWPLDTVYFQYSEQEYKRTSGNELRKGIVKWRNGNEVVKRTIFPRIPYSPYIFNSFTFECMIRVSHIPGWRLAKLQHLAVKENCFVYIDEDYFQIRVLSKLNEWYSRYSFTCNINVYLTLSHLHEQHNRTICRTIIHHRSLFNTVIIFEANFVFFKVIYYY